MHGRAGWTAYGVAFALAAFAMMAAAQQPAPPPVRPSYGQGINLETAKRIAAASVVEAKKNSWNMAIAIVDNHGMLVYYEMADDTQTASANVAVEKARTSAMWRRTTKEFEDNIAGGRVAILGFPGVTPIEGGLPIIVNNRMVGAIGVSGGTSPQDGQVAKAGLEALK